MAIHCKLSREFHISIVIETFRITCMVFNFTFTEDNIFWLCCPRILIHLCRLILPSGLGHTTISPSKGRKSQKMFPVCIICTAVHPMNSTEHCKSYTSTHQHWNTETLKHCNTETLKHCNTSTLKHCNELYKAVKQNGNIKLVDAVTNAEGTLTFDRTRVAYFAIWFSRTHHNITPKRKKVPKMFPVCIICTAVHPMHHTELQCFSAQSYTSTLKHCHTAMNFTMQWSRT